MHMLNNRIYKAFGLHIASDIALSELPATAGIQKADVVIKQEALLETWGQAEGKTKHLYVTKNHIMFRIPDVAIFSVKEGRDIFYCPLSENINEKIKLYLLGSCMGAVLMQRKILPLHGSAVAVNGKVYAVVGESGAGKSTLASAFLNSGFQLLSDDVIPVSISAEGIPLVTPAYPQQKLWMESLNYFGMDAAQYRPIFDRETKFTVPVTESFTTQTMPLAGVFELTVSDSEEIELQPVLSMKRFETIYTHTYRQFFLERAGLLEWHFDISAKLLASTNVYKLKRPKNGFSAHELKEKIMEEIKKGSEATSGY